jgi:hypothetical protein
MSNGTKRIVLLIGMFAVMLHASAQTVTGSGTVSTVPVFTGSSTVGNSIITQSGSHVGIGTASPLTTLDIAGTLRSTAQVVPSSGVGLELLYFSGAGYLQAYSRSASVYTPLKVEGSTLSLNTASGGNVGVGTSTPGAKLEVDGNVRLTSGSGASITFADGTVQSTAYTGVICGGDYAESVDVMGGRMNYEPGDLLVIDPKAPGRFLKSAEPYSTLVAGIYSTKPGTVGRRETTYAKTDTTAVPMAMMGIVPTKVTAENGPIKTGDLMVTSSTVGYAMRGTDRGRLTGAVVGKALGSLDSGTGVIEVLVTLQ